MKHFPLFVIFLTLIAPTFLSAQYGLDRRNVGSRLICIVPMVGAGTYDDPKRPLYAPKPEEQSNKGDGIISYRFELSDDGKTALVELVARTPEAFKAILSDRRPDVRVFRKGLTTKEEIEEAFKGQKKDFKADSYAEGKR